MQRLALTALASLLAACTVTSHPTESATLGQSSRSAAMLAVLDQPGPLTVETVNSADWQVTRAGLIDLDDPKAKQAGLVDGDEPIQIYFHVLRHPTHGLFVIDTGVERALRDAPDSAAVRGMVTRFMHLDAMKVHEPLGDFLAKQKEPLRGVLMTHLHLDHVTGMADVPAGTPIYTGPGEAGARAFLHLFVQGSTDRALAGKPALREWRFARDPDGRFEAVHDVFGDGSLFALWVPGHTPGSVAFVARTVDGPVLIAGDTCHTRWGWEHEVPPGSFTGDRPQNAAALSALRTLAAEHPKMAVRLGHQH